MTASLLRSTALLTSCIALSACAEKFERDPQVSKIGMDPQTMYEAQTVQVPMPEPKPARTPYRAEAASLWEQGSKGFFGDQRATEVGDILTIDIEIDDTQIDKILPGVGPEDLPSGNIVDISSLSGASGSGSIKRNEAISLKVAALVVQQLPNGNLVVVGRQEVKVNEELRELKVSGIIRPQDIDMDNTIPYDKIAEARISYGGRGSVSHQQTRQYGEDLMDVILPY